MSDICDLFTIESLSKDFPHEGELLCSTLRRIGKRPIYMEVRNKEELKNALVVFKMSNYRYIHFSCHGTETSVTLSDCELLYSDFASLSTGCFNNKRLFFSACLLGNDIFSEEIINYNPGLQSIVAPINKIFEGYSFAMWVTFYLALFLPKRKTQKTETETSNISFQELMRLLGKTIAIIGEPIHCSYHETAKNVLYHKKLIPKARIKNASFFSSVKPYKTTPLN